MLVQSNTSTRDTVGVAAASSRGRKAGAVYGSKSVKQTALAAKYTPPSKPGYGVAVIAILIGIGLIPAGFAGGPPTATVMGFAAILIGVFLIRATPAKQRNWQARIDRLSKLWICKKCGNEWTPVDVE
jgi:hypothetical protein